MAEPLNLYYEGYDKSKNYDFIRFNASRPLQSRELNEMQLINEHRHKMLTGSIIENGTTLSGSYSKQNNKVALLNIKVAINSIIYDVPDQEVSIKPGESLIAIKVEHKVIDSKKDPNLIDPFIEGANGGIAGADRRKFTLVIKAFSPSNIPDEYIPIAKIGDDKAYPIIKSHTISHLAKRCPYTHVIDINYGESLNKLEGLPDYASVLIAGNGVFRLDEVVEIKGNNILIEFSHSCVFAAKKPFKIKTKGICTINNLHIRSQDITNRSEIFSPSDGIVFISNMIMDNGGGDIGVENGYEKPRRA